VKEKIGAIYAERLSVHDFIAFPSTRHTRERAAAHRAISKIRPFVSKTFIAQSII